MGLSDQERLYGLYSGVSSLYQIKIALELEKDSLTFYDSHKILPEVIRVLDEIWYSFLQTRSDNNMLWIFGSSVSNWFSSKNQDPWSVALGTHCDGLLDRLYTDEDIIDREEEFSNRFNVFNGFLDIGSLVGGNNKTAKLIFEIYLICESLSYRLRRYHDEFLEKYANLDKAICKLFGLTYTIMKSEDVFAKAYLINKACYVIYDNYYCHDDPDDWDIVTKWCVKQSIHHHLSRMMGFEYTVTDVAKICIIAFNGYNQSLGNIQPLVTYTSNSTGQKLLLDSRYDNLKFRRLLTAIKLSGDKFKSERDHKELIALIRTDNELKWFVEDIKLELELCKTNKKEYNPDRHQDADWDCGELFGSVEGIQIIDPLRPKDIY